MTRQLIFTSLKFSILLVDIRPDTGLWTNIRQDTGYLDKYPTRYRFSGIYPNIGYLDKYPDRYLISGSKNFTPDINFDTRIPDILSLVFCKKNFLYTGNLVLCKYLMEKKTNLIRQNTELFIIKIRFSHGTYIRR